MPVTIKNKPEPCRNPKRSYRIAKHPKRSKTLSEQSLDTEDTQDDIQIEQQMSTLSKKDLVTLLKQVHSRFKYGLDTLLAALMLLKRINFEVEESRGKLLAAALLMIAGKVHEFRTPQYLDLAIWGSYAFGKNELIAAEGQLLIHFGFKVPTALNLNSLEEAKINIAKI